MGYRIEYGQTVTKEIFTEQHNTRKFRRMIATILIISAIIILIFCLKTDSLKEILLPGDPEVTEAALTVFAEDVKSGMRVTEAFVTFCREIIKGANIF